MISNSRGLSGSLVSQRVTSCQLADAGEAGHWNMNFIERITFFNSSFVAILSRNNGTEPSATAERVTERDRNAAKDLTYGSKKQTRTT